MPESYQVEVSQLHGFLQDFLDQLKLTHVAQVKVILYVVADSRVMQLLALTRQNKQTSFDTARGGWTKTKNQETDWEQSGSVMKSSDAKTIFIPIPALQDSRDLVGVIEIHSTAPMGKGVGNGNRFSLAADRLTAGRVVFEKVRLAILLNWQLEVLNVLHRVGKLDHTAFSLDRVFSELLTAALSIAPLACLGHIMTVLYDPETGEPKTLQLEYAQPSRTTKPAHPLKVQGRCSADHELYAYSVNEGLTGACVRERRPRYFDVLRDAPRYKRLHDGTQSEACYPLIVGDQVIGVLNLESELTSAFSESDRDNLQVLANEITLILSAVSGMQTRMKLYEKGLVTFREILRLLNTPQLLIEAVLDWSREMSTPAFDYASFSPGDNITGLEFAQSGNKPDQAGGLDTVLILEHQGNVIGTLLLLTASENTSLLNHAVKTIESFKPVLEAAIHAALVVTSSLEHDATGWLASAIRHTVHDINSSFQTNVSQSTDRTVKQLDGAFDLIQISCDILSSEFDTTVEDSFIDVDEAAKKVWQAMKWRFESEGIALIFHPLSGERAFIRGKQSTLMWALFELLNNALKFSKQKHADAVHLTVGRILGSEDVTVSVDDNCDIIPRTERSSIWRRSVRGEHARAAAIPGSGLGLSIVARCCANLKGEYEVRESRLLNGNCFELRFKVVG